MTYLRFIKARGALLANLGDKPRQKRKQVPRPQPKPRYHRAVPVADLP